MIMLLGALSAFTIIYVIQTLRSRAKQKRRALYWQERHREMDRRLLIALETKTPYQMLPPPIDYDDFR